MAPPATRGHRSRRAAATARRQMPTEMIVSVASGREARAARSTRAAAGGQRPVAPRRSGYANSPKFTLRTPEVDCLTAGRVETRSVARAGRAARVRTSGADDGVGLVERRQVAADERRNTRFVSNPVAERRQEAAAIVGPVVVDRLAGLDVDQVGAGRAQARAIAIPSSTSCRAGANRHGEPRRHGPAQTLRTASSTCSGKRRRSSSWLVSGDR